MADMISNRDYIVIVDASGSMSTHDCPNGKSRWEYMQETLVGVVNRVCELDPDGITVYTFNVGFKKIENVKSEADVKSIFAMRPGMGTNMAPVLRDAINNLKGPTTILVVTDGEANDPHETAQTILNATKKLESDEDLAISFFQIGKDYGARDFLQRLDDGLEGAGAKFDIVDTKTMDDLNNTSLDEALIMAIID